MSRSDFSKNSSAFFGYRKLCLNNIIDLIRINAAKTILGSGSFVTDVEDYEKSLRLGFTIGECQGNQQLRKTARKYTKNCPDIFLPEIIRKAGEVYEKNFRILQIKRLGHALNLNSCHFFLKDGTRIHYDGFNESFTLPMLASSVVKFSQQNNSVISKKEGAWIANMLIGSTSHDSYTGKDAANLCDWIRDANNKQVISISSGYDWHAIHLFFFRGFVIYCNRGYGCGINPGISVTFMPERDYIDDDIVVSLIKRHALIRSEWENRFNFSSLSKALHLLPVYYLIQKEQKIGNCTYISAKCGVRVLMALNYLINKFGDKAIPKTSDVWENAFSQTERKYKAFSSFDKVIVVEDLLNDAKYLVQEESSILSKERFRDIFYKVEQKMSYKKQRYKTVLPRFAGLLKV